MLPITINNEPYRYMQQHKHKLLYTSVAHTGMTVVQPGEYVLLDRHFNTFILSEKQMDYYIRDDYARYRRELTAKRQKGKNDNAK
jgi:hypothetical protein